ncbi:hypothetical protein AAUPMB_14775 [Pasteurella multocida subsp. multocida str. Anand1_buffalo]|nr:hypothetical protein AAUPMB_14775 [Pasteurella multocida subsp. multocida str. Anand1_buffalo]
MGKPATWIAEQAGFKVPEKPIFWWQPVKKWAKTNPLPVKNFPQSSRY